MLLFVLAAAVIAAEAHRPGRENKVLLVLLENNEEITELVLRHICRKARGGKGGIQVLVVDNYSTDGTVPIIRCLEKYFPEIELLARNDLGSFNFCQLKRLLDGVFEVFDFRDV